MRKQVWWLSGLVLLTACGGGRSGTSLQEQKRLTEQYDSLHQEVAQRWQVMIDDDNEKLFYMKRLLDEVSYTGHYDQEQYDSLSQAVQALKLTRYDSMTMANSDLIDAYDAATSALTSQVITLAQNHPEFTHYPLMEELIYDISEASDRVLMHRISFDQAARGYNQFIQQQGRKLNGDILARRPDSYPVFSLSGE